MKKIEYCYLEWCKQGGTSTIDDRLLRFELASDRDYWLEKFNLVDRLGHARVVDESDPSIAVKYDLEDFYTDRFSEGDRCPSGHFYYEIPPREN